MRGFRFLLPFVIFLAASCNFPRLATNPASAETVEISATATPGNWTGGVFRVETENLAIDYPDFLNPAEAKIHADALQKAYVIFREIFAFGDEPLYGGQKAAIEFRTTTAVSMAGHNRLYMGSEIIDGMREGYLNPPDPIFFHEMGHLFETAEEDAGRYYIFHLIGGMNEGLVDYFKCHPEILKLWEANPRADEVCDLILYGIGAKGPEWTLAFLESNPADIYALNWNEHPSGVCGEVLFPQMLARVSEIAGWGVWKKFFLLTKASAGNPSAKEAYLAWAEKKPLDRMREPLVKQAFAEFIADLSQAADTDLRAMFRRWGFEL